MQQVILFAITLLSGVCKSLTHGDSVQGIVVEHTVLTLQRKINTAFIVIGNRRGYKDRFWQVKNMAEILKLFETELYI